MNSPVQLLCAARCLLSLTLILLLLLPHFFLEVCFLLLQQLMVVLHFLVCSCSVNLLYRAHGTSLPGSPSFGALLRPPERSRRSRAVRKTGGPVHGTSRQRHLPWSSPKTGTSTTQTGKNAGPMFSSTLEGPDLSVSPAKMPLQQGTLIVKGPGASRFSDVQTSYFAPVKTILWQ